MTGENVTAKSLNIDAVVSTEALSPDDIAILVGDLSVGTRVDG